MFAGAHGMHQVCIPYPLEIRHWNRKLIPSLEAFLSALPSGRQKLKCRYGGAWAAIMVTSLPQTHGCHGFHKIVREAGDVRPLTML